MELKKCIDEAVRAREEAPHPPFSGEGFHQVAASSPGTYRRSDMYNDSERG
ncbi:MAG: hypothetical protein AAFU64_13640 [Bacteroidota bacterium]